MPLPAHIVAMFPQVARKKGRAYAANGEVQVKLMTGDTISALVRGDATYTVEADLSSLDAPQLSCSCPAWERWGPCKHLWATLLEADRSGLAVLQPESTEPVAEKDDGPPDWEGRLEALREVFATRPVAPVIRHISEILYVIDRVRTRRALALVVAIFARRRLRSGKWGILRSYSAAMRDEPPFHSHEDEQVLAALRGAAEWSRDIENPDAFLLDAEQTALFVPLLCSTGRLLLDEPTADDELERLRFEPEPRWRLLAALEEDAAAERVRLHAEVVRGDQTLLPDDVDLLTPTGIVIHEGVASPLQMDGSAPWLRSFLEEGPMAAALGDRDAFVESLLALPGIPPIRGAGFEIVPAPAPGPHLDARSAVEAGPGWVDCRVYADYGTDRVRLADPVSAVLDDEGRRRLLRDPAAERRAAAEILEHPEALTAQSPESDLSLPAAVLVMLLPTLLEAGWTVEAAGKQYRPAGRLRASISSGIDWFGVTGGVEFGDEVATLPELLRAVRAGSRTVRLGDGSLGLLPEEILRSWGLLSSIGRVEDDGLHFDKHQGWLIDALLAGKRGVDVDAGFQAYRERLQGFDGIGSTPEPETFRGELRAYQREGLAWLDFLREFGCGGCLADDMGLGKTVQVLAMLEERRIDAEDRAPALVVAPRSVVFNWIDEAARFTPDLRVIDYSGPGRKKALRAAGDGVHLIVTTYGVLRRDVEELCRTPFDYVILDESQAVKNHATQASKAARALTAKHRLALSGTPLENHLTELWSLFEFLNPGMLGRSSAFRRLTQKGANESIDREGRALLARALRPFLLRRTKEQVATDLPEKTEQTLHCEMPPRQKRLYRELSQHYREALLSKGSAPVLQQSRMHVLEALLRLRQAACHPGLLDPARTKEASAKLDALMPLLEEVIEEGHKALVFSQFTSMLAIVRERVEAAGLKYEYLDGQTRDRKSCVDRFQTDESTGLFLISLRAGGLGLNLTAADYVFILDPWWNPAVEAQAIDRTYRIGQTRHVMAYRLVCKDTVEEKILELQARKRDLADAILTDDNAVLSSLSPEDLELLLS